MSKEWNDKAWLATALQEARAETLAVYAQLSEEHWHFPLKSNLNLPAWELGHIAYFQEWWCLRRGGMGSILPNADAWYDSAKVGHAYRWQLPLLSHTATHDYLQAVLDLTLQALKQVKTADLYFYHLVLLHEHMHREAMLMALYDLNLGERPHSFAPYTPLNWLQVAGGRHEVGAHPQMAGQQFIWDNEKWAHQVEISAFEMADRLVTEAEYALFDPHFSVTNQDAPVLGINHTQASAFAAWCGARLPTEHEWTVAAQSAPLQQLFGSAWQWTSSVFAPFPGFAPDPYEEYSAPWFDGKHYVLKGSSPVTSPLLATLTYRNFYLPHRRDVLAGIRLAR